MIRITLDTNQLLRALMRPPELATLIMAWQSGRFRVIASADLLHEYERIITTPTITKLILPELMRAYRGHLVHLIDLIETPVIAPICRDPDDDKVIATAVYGRVRYLVSEDSDLQTRSARNFLTQYSITVVSTEQLLHILDEPE